MVVQDQSRIVALDLCRGGMRDPLTPFAFHGGVLVAGSCLTNLATFNHPTAAAVVLRFSCAPGLPLKWMCLEGASTSSHPATPFRGHLSSNRSLFSKSLFQGAGSSIWCITRFSLVGIGDLQVSVLVGKVKFCSTALLWPANTVAASGCTDSVLVRVSTKLKCSRCDYSIYYVFKQNDIVGKT